MSLVARGWLTGQVDITTSATLLKAGVSRRCSLGIRNMDATNPIYIGPLNTVSTTNGWLLKANESIILESPTDVYAIATGGTVRACWSEENQ